MRGVRKHSNQIRVWGGIKSSEFFNVSVNSWKYGSLTYTSILLCSCAQFIALNEEKKPAVRILSIFTSKKIHMQNASRKDDQGSSLRLPVMLSEAASRLAVMMSEPAKKSELPADQPRIKKASKIFSSQKN